MKIVSTFNTHKSLDEFCKKYPSRIGERILLYTKDYQKDEVVTCLPVYYAGYLFASVLCGLFVG